MQPNKSSWDIVTEGIKIELLRIVQLMPNINRYVIQCETDKRLIRTITYRLRAFLPCRVKEDCGVFMQLQQEARVSSVSSEVNEVVNLNICKWASRIPQFHEIHNPTKNIISRQGYSNPCSSFSIYGEGTSYSVKYHDFFSKAMHKIILKIKGHKLPQALLVG